MSNPGVQTVSSVAERAKVALAIAAFIAGLAGFYILGDQPMIARVGALIAGIVVAVVIAWFSEPGRRFLGFAQDSYNEVRRVVWPTRKETIQMTATVFAFVVVMAIFLWVADKLIQWVLYGLLLGWN
jgi:preprotein translocase subunit SecE